MVRLNTSFHDNVVHLSDGPGPVPNEVIPVPPPPLPLPLSHHRCQQVVHGEPKHLRGAELVGKRLLLQQQANKQTNNDAKVQSHAKLWT